jgi:hypothetical protein
MRYVTIKSIENLRSQESLDDRTSSCAMAMAYLPSRGTKGQSRAGV